jgi:hypothetical protein
MLSSRILRAGKIGGAPPCDGADRVSSVRQLELGVQSRRTARVDSIPVMPILGNGLPRTCRE